MKDILGCLEQKESELKEIIADATKIIKGTPVGAVQVCVKKGRYLYYHYYTDERKQKTIRKYIKKEDEELAYKLAQGDYAKKIKLRAEKQLRQIKSCRKVLAETSLAEVYKNLNRNRKHLVVPVEMTDEMFIEKWEKTREQSANPYPIETELYTEKGERVRSKSEKIIADELHRLGIPYKYEAPLRVDGGSMVYPDFTLLDVKRRREWYLEHMGMLQNEEYMAGAMGKMDRYIANGIIPGKNLIVTYEKKEGGLNTRNLEKLIRSYLG